MRASRPLLHFGIAVLKSQPPQPGPSRLMTSKCSLEQAAGESQRRIENPRRSIAHCLPQVAGKKPWWGT